MIFLWKPKLFPMFSQDQIELSVQIQAKQLKSIITIQRTGS